jgi:leader peptidase (prepilin peptidase)/N-methyltransferase
MEIIIFIFGLLVGSFLNSVIYRSTSGGSIFALHSKCPDCGHILGLWDLIPVASFLWLRGRCRYCEKPISWQYPLVEVATALAFILIFNRLSIIDYRLFFYFVFTSLLITIFVQDLKHYLILDRMVLSGSILAIIYQLALGNFWQGFLGAVLLSGFFGILYLVSRGRWIGLGDVKLGFFLGFLMGYPVVLVLFFLAYFFGAAVSGLLLLTGRRKLRDRLPFGTFLTVASFIAMLWGEEIIQWYFRLIGISI